MQVTMEGAPVFAHLQIDLDPGESLTAEPDAMASMSADLELRSKLNGGFFAGLARKILGGESLFINQFTNLSDGQRRLTITQTSPGDMRCVELQEGESLGLQPGAYVCSETTISMGLKWAGFASWFGREGLFKMRILGPGKVWFGGYGAVVERILDGETIVDTSHLVAYDPEIKLHVQLSGGLFSSFFSGEGFVTRLQGKGRYWIQTRSIEGFSSWLNHRI